MIWVIGMCLQSLVGRFWGSRGIILPLPFGRRRALSPAVAIARAMLAPGIQHCHECTTKISKWLHNVSTLVINGKLSPHTRILLQETEFLSSGCKTRASFGCFRFLSFGVSTCFGVPCTAHRFLIFGDFGIKRSILPSGCSQAQYISFWEQIRTDHPSMCIVQASPPTLKCCCTPCQSHVWSFGWKDVSLPTLHQEI